MAGDLILSSKYFHADNGAKLDANYQTGWTGTIALLMDIFERFDAKGWPDSDHERMRTQLVTDQVGGESAGKTEPAIARG